MRDIDYITRILNGHRAPNLFNVDKLAEINQPKLLDLYCGAGGATKGYQQAGFYVVGLDIRPQSNYCGDMFILADAIDWLTVNISIVKEHFQAIHASPPCQAYSSATNNMTRNSHPRVIANLRKVLERTELPYIIENVKGFKQDLLNPFMLCGSSFNLRVRRHRLFETNFPVEALECDHAWQDDNPMFVIYEDRRWKWRGTAAVYGNGGGKSREYWPWAMGCGSTWDDCWMNTYELSQAIPPAYTKHIGGFIKKDTQNVLSSPAYGCPSL